MTDEDSFLAALKLNPADDTTRLVYADWLDEHDRPAHAAYLRAVADLTRLRGGTPDYTAAAVRLYTAAAETDSDWRATAGARFNVVLESYTDKVKAIIVIRERTGFGLGEAKALAESVPVALFSWLSFEAALPHLLAFQRTNPKGPGYPVRASIRPTPWSEGSFGTTFDVILDALDTADDEPGGGLSRHAIGLSSILGVTLEEVQAHVTRLPLTLATGLKPAQVADFVQQVQRACNVMRGLPPKAIRVVPRPPKE